MNSPVSAVICLVSSINYSSHIVDELIYKMNSLTYSSVVNRGKKNEFTQINFSTCIYHLPNERISI